MTQSTLLIKPLTIGIVAGEVSGDALGADFMQQMNAIHPNIRWVGVGGVQMAAQGLHSVIELSRLSVMGLVEVIKHLPDLLRAKKEILTAFDDVKIDVFVGIDAPDFNLDWVKCLSQTVCIACSMSAHQSGHGVKIAFMASRRRPIWCCVYSPLSLVSMPSISTLLSVSVIHSLPSYPLTQEV